MAVTKPDATAFDNANDSIATSRAELYTLVTSFNTIADEYNAGTLGATDVQAGPNTEIKAYDSAGANQIIAYGPEHFTETSRTFSSSGNVTAELPANYHFIATNTTGTLNSVNLFIPTYNADWDLVGEDRAPYPALNASYVSYMTITAPSSNNANVDIQMIVQTTSGNTNLGSAVTFTAGTEKLYRVTVIQNNTYADSAGAVDAWINIEDLTASATRVVVSTSP